MSKINGREWYIKAVNAKSRHDKSVKADNMYTLKNKWVFAYVYGYQRAEHYPLISVCNFNYNKLPKDALTRGVVYLSLIHI